MKALIRYFTTKQKLLLLIDSVGAVTTAFFLLLIIHLLNPYFQIPYREATYLSATAVLLALYSATCYVLLRQGFAPFIRFIGIANLVYCAFTIALLIRYYPSLTIIGKTYFLSEIAIIGTLSYIELRVATKNR